MQPKLKKKYNSFKSKIIIRLKQVYYHVCWRQNVIEKVKATSTRSVRRTQVKTLKRIARERKLYDTTIFRCRYTTIQLTEKLKRRRGSRLKRKSWPETFDDRKRVATRNVNNQSRYWARNANYEGVTAS